jgi:hypothetical protein
LNNTTICSSWIPATSFIKVQREYLISFFLEPNKGFIRTDATLSGGTDGDAVSNSRDINVVGSGNYKRGGWNPTGTNGGVIQPANGVNTTNVYFFKGNLNADCLDFIRRLNLI